MTRDEINVVLSGILHDIGKIIYREGVDQRKHSKSGYDFLKDEIGLAEQDILDSVLYHHGDMLAKATVSENSISYITYIADNIASATDRRKNDSDDVGFEMSLPLESVFNILNGNNKKCYYEPTDLDEEKGINYPIEEGKKYDKHYYAVVKDRLKDNLKGIEWNDYYINSLLEVFEANSSFIPSSTCKGEVADISLYDHVKLTAAIGICIYKYLQEKDINNYKETLFTNAQKFYEEKAFLLYSMDISGIQQFIYSIDSKGALKNLRARSFYLEILMEHIIDMLIDRVAVCRTNLIYSGGGHCYILLPNTSKTKDILVEFEKEINNWLLKQFGISLYIAGGFGECSCNSLKNNPNGSYSMIYKAISEMISSKKMHRYSVEDIINLNFGGKLSGKRECRICKNIMDSEEDICQLCSHIEKLSAIILYKDFFTIEEDLGQGIPLPGGYCLVADDENTLKSKLVNNDNQIIRTYGKNRLYTGKKIATKLWVGEYSSESDFLQLAKASKGIERIGVLRADVDNLGHAFVHGFDNAENKNKYVTLSRTATLSRQLSMFFKRYINSILCEGNYYIEDETAKHRNATIVYSGGDDLFIVGSWNDVVELAVDISEAFEKYTLGTLTISAGIGVYNHNYPISVIADEVARLEEASKSIDGKNAVTLFQEEIVRNGNATGSLHSGTFKWSVFRKGVIGEKYRCLNEYFCYARDKGNALLYNILQLLQNRSEKINFARYVYLLSRLEPEKNADSSIKNIYTKFSRNMYEWMKNEEDVREIVLAIYIYIYLHREKEEC